jgi:cellulose synthase/poly-beta-1,6-N-acetylglucosamine synthase-like glycosyltransferase
MSHLFDPSLYPDISIMLFGVFVIFSSILLLYYWVVFSRVAFKRPNPVESHPLYHPISVIICAKDEYENLKKNLPSILEQDYPDFEVILVNDFSEDDTYFLIKSYQEKYPHFKVINLRENVNFFAGKKLALALGIKSAKNKIVLLTDADCRPESRQWIESMSSLFTKGVNVVLGYGGYRKKPGFLNSLIRYDTATIAMQYMGFAFMGKPYMGVGRNLAYKKDLFFKAGGFASHYKINSGDDDLFINKNAKGKFTRVALNKESFTFSEPKRTFTSWFKQKKRHLSTSRYYKFSDKFLLGLFGISQTLFYVSFALFLFFTQWSLPLWIASGLFFLKIVSLMVLHYYAGKKYIEPKLFLYSPLFDFIFALLNPIFALSNLFYRKNKWK